LRNIDHKIKVFCVLIASFFGLGLLTGCQHNPVYPDIGSVYIYTDPDKAEVIMDGQMLRLMTPVKIDGIRVGQHTFTLRHNNYKVTTFQMEVKPGQTRTVYKRLSPIFLQKRDTLNVSAGDMELAASGDIFLTNVFGDNITVARMSDNGQISMVDQIYVGGPQRLIAASDIANRVFVTRPKPDSLEDLVGLEIISHKLIRTISVKNVKYYTALAFSPDGNILVAADSSNKRLILIDPHLCSVIKTINTTAYPTDLSFDKNNLLQIYVTQSTANQSGANRFDLINLETGAVVSSVSTGNSPGRIFWNNYATQVAFCNRTDLTYTIVNLDNWTKATSDREIVGKSIAGACWTASDIYVLWAMDHNVGIMYIPNWQQTSKIFNLRALIKILLTKDKRYLLMLNQTELVTVAVDI